MKAVAGALSVVLLLSCSVDVLASQPVKLEPSPHPRVVKWQSENFKFQLQATCRVNFDGLFTKTDCAGAYLYVSSSIEFDDQRSSVSSPSLKGERELRSTDISFAVQGKTVYDWSNSDTRWGSTKRSHKDLLNALRNDPTSTLTLTYPVGTLREISLSMPWDSSEKKAEPKASHRNIYRTESFQLSGFSEALSSVESAASNAVRKEMIMINAALSALYMFLAALAVVTTRLISRKAVASTKKTASKLEETLTERRIQSETKALHIREEAHRRFEADKIKQLIQEALKDDDQ